MTVAKCATATPRKPPRSPRLSSELAERQWPRYSLETCQNLSENSRQAAKSPRNLSKPFASLREIQNFSDRLSGIV